MMRAGGEAAHVGRRLHDAGDMPRPLAEAVELIESPERAKEMIDAEDSGGDGGVHLLVIGFGEMCLQVDVVHDIRQRERHNDEMQKAIHGSASDGLPSLRDEVVQVEKGPGEKDGDVDRRYDLQRVAQVVHDARLTSSVKAVMEATRLTSGAPKG